MSLERRMRELELRAAEVERLLARATQRPPLIIGGGGPPVVRFRIFESDCDACSAVGEILSRPADASRVPGEYEIYGELNDDLTPKKFVDLQDKTGCYLNEPDDDLVGRLGYATYLTGEPKCAYQPGRGWEITALCEQQTECEI
jgi:hypothetical protein